jgi:LPS-assembly protein
MILKTLPLVALLFAGLARGQAPQNSLLSNLDALTELTEKLGAAEIDGTPSFSQEKLTFSDGVHFRGANMEVFADNAEYVIADNKMYINGNVSIYRDGMVYRGSKAVYDTQSEMLDVNGMKSSLEPKFPLYYTSQNLAASKSGGEGGAQKIEGSDVDLTAHDAADPSFFLRAKDVTIYPEDRVVFKNIKVYAGDTPIFWLPYLSQPLQEEQGLLLTPGFRSNLGGFILGQYGDTIGDHSTIKYKLDGYSSRGIAVGADIQSRRYQGTEFGKFKFYWINDTNPTETFVNTVALRETIDPNRYRVNLQHRIYLPGPEESNLYVDVDLNKLSDQFFYEDFFPWEFREDPQPDNMVNFVKRFEGAEVSLLTRARLNDFYGTDSRLPELAVDFTRQPLFGSGVFYNGTSSFGILRDQLGEPDVQRLKDRIEQVQGIVDGTVEDQDTALEKLASKSALQEGDKLDINGANDLLSQLKGLVNETRFNRLHTYNEFAYPISIDGKFTLTPKIGGGFTNYSGVKSANRPLDSSRALVSAGLDLSTKFSKVYEGANWMGLDGLRHTIQPYVNWSFVSADDLGTNFRGVDRLVNSTRPRPVDVGNWTAVDSLRDWNLMRIGVANRFQTKRNGGNYSWLRTNTYFDAYADDPEFDRDFSNLYTDVEWQPLTWTRLGMSVQLPVFGGDNSFTEIASRATFMPQKSWEVSMGYRLLQDHPFFQDSNLIDLSNYWRINDKWGVSSYQRLEVEDSTLELQQYSLHRDLNSWAMALGGIIRDNRGETEYGLIFSMTLKQFPSLRIPIDFDPNGGAGQRR